MYALMARTILLYLLIVAGRYNIPANNGQTADRRTAAQ